MWDWNTPVEDYLAGMAEGVKVGKIRQIGIANCFAWQLAEAPPGPRPPGRKSAATGL